MTHLPDSTSDAPVLVRRRSDAVSVDVLVLPEPCYRCGTMTRSIVGFLVPPDLTEHPAGFVDFEVLAPLLVRRVSSGELARWGVGPIKTRRSRYRPEGYLSNGCINCDAIQGSFPLHEDLMEFIAEGGAYQELVIGRWPLPRSEIATPALVG